MGKVRILKTVDRVEERTMVRLRNIRRTQEYVEASSDPENTVSEGYVRMNLNGNVIEKG